MKVEMLIFENSFFHLCLWSKSTNYSTSLMMHYVNDVKTCVLWIFVSVASVWMCGTLGPLHKHGMCASLTVTSRKACLHMYISEVKHNTNSLSAFIPVFVLSSHSRFCGCLMYLDFMLPDHHSLSLPAGLNLFLCNYHCYLQDWFLSLPSLYPSVIYKTRIVDVWKNPKRGREIATTTASTCKFMLPLPPTYLPV